MKKKKLLSEAQVKRFMGLAGIKPLNEMSYMEEDEEMSEMRHSMKKDDEMREMRGEMKKDDDMHEMRGEMKRDEMREEEEMEDEGGEADVEMDEQGPKVAYPSYVAAENLFGWIYLQFKGHRLGYGPMGRFWRWIRQ